MTPKNAYLIIGIAAVIIVVVIAALVFIQNDDGDKDNTPGIKDIELDMQNNGEHIDFEVRVIGLPENNTVVLQWYLGDNEPDLNLTSWYGMDEEGDRYTVSMWVQDSTNITLNYRVVAFEGLVSPFDNATPIYETEWKAFEIP